jgi:FAD-dependent oxidoreductase domain-containing protein 1
VTAALPALVLGDGHPSGGRKHVVVGGGMVGMCVSYYLGLAGVGRDVVVLEPDPSYESGSTRWSAAAIRTQFHLGINVAMSLVGFEFFSRTEDLLSVDGEPADIAFECCPYLVLSGPDGVERMREAHRRQQDNGADVQFLEPAELAQRVRWLKLDGLGGATLGRASEGWMDPLAALAALRRKASSLGVTFVAERAVGFDIRGGRIDAVVLASGERVAALEVVNAAGARAREVAALAGVAVPIEARLRTAFVFSTPAPVESFLNLVEPTFTSRGVYARPYGNAFMAVTSPAPADDVERFDREPNMALFEEIVRPALSRRVRGFEQMTLERAWAGHYEVNTFDQNAIIGRVAQPANLLLACGFTGHGVMHAPAAGRGITELILAGGYQTLDLSAFDFSRIAERAPLDDIQPSEQRRRSAGV